MQSTACTPGCGIEGPDVGGDETEWTRLDRECMRLKQAALARPSQQHQGDC